MITTILNVKRTRNAKCIRNSRSVIYAKRKSINYLPISIVNVSNDAMSNIAWETRAGCPVGTNRDGVYMDKPPRHERRAVKLPKPGMLAK